MKKIFIIMILLLSGCSVKENILTKINEDQSMELTIISAFDDEFLNGAMNEINKTDDKKYTEKEMWSFLEERISPEKEKGYYEIEKYEKDGYKGYTFTLKIDNIDDITSDDASFDIRDYTFLPEQKLFKKEGEKYISKIYYSEISGEKYVDYDLTFEITLPYETLSNNADEVSSDGKTLKWNTASGEKDEINFEFSFNPDYKDKINDNIVNSNIYLIIGSTVICVILVAGILLFIKKRNKA